MDSQTAITVEDVSKIYRIGSKERTHDSLGGMMVDFVKSPLENYRKYRSLYNFKDVAADGKAENIIWALDGVSFEVKRGEVVGIIGGNGAGKSTLLKILARITPPTRGKVEIRGKVSSLLEVGTGFHPELTGRENVYLNGTILGMRKREVDQKFGEIVDFSEVEKFLDTPVKRYSSGMRVRLAFAVAAHLEPEILIVDEVLAVGDSAFQNKCLNKMQDVGAEGRTVLFVSHNMPAVNRLCSRGIHIDQGTVIEDGPAEQVVGAYLSSDTGTSAAREYADPGNAPGGEAARLCGVRIISSGGDTVDTVDVREPVGLEMTYDVLESGHVLQPHYFVYDAVGAVVFVTLDQDPDWYQKPRPAGRYTSTAWIPGNYLSEGMLFVSSNMFKRRPDIKQYNEQQIISFNVVEQKGEGTARGDWTGELKGAVRPLLKWTTRVNDQEQQQPVLLKSGGV